MASHYLNSNYGRTLAELTFDPATFQGNGSSGDPYLFIQGRLDYVPLENPNVDLLFREVRAQLRVENAGRVAHSRPMQLHRLRRGYSTGSVYDYVSLEFPLDVQRIAVLERARNGGDLAVRIFLEVSIDEFGIIEGDAGTKRPSLWGLNNVYTTTVDINLQIPRSTWVEQVLPRIGFGRVHLIELPAVPISACERLKSSFEALKQAEHRHKNGLYDDAVGKCRVALEPLLERIEKKDDNGNLRQYSILRKTWERRLGRATYDWLNDSFRAVKEVANPNHHSVKEHYDQFESEMILAITTTLIAFAARHEDAEV